MITPYVGASALRAHVVSSVNTTDVVRGLVNGRTYRFKVAVKDPAGTGPSSATNPVTVGVPTAPGGVTAQARNGKAVVRWTAPASVAGAQITAYVVTPYRNSVAQNPLVFKSRATIQTIKGLRVGRHYTFRVAARNARGRGPQSAESNGVVPT